MDIKTKSNSHSNLYVLNKSEKTSSDSSSSNSIIEKQLHDVSSLYEKQFLREMVKQMRSTISESQIMPSSFAEKYYREELDHQYVESWGDQGGIGLGKMIYEQLVSKYGSLLGLKLPNQMPSGPIPLTQKDQWRGSINSNTKSIQFTIKKTNESSDSYAIKNPWDGEWLGSYSLGNGMKAIEIKHQGFKSQIVGEFQNFSGEPGMKIKAGSDLGFLNPNSKNLYWKLQDSNESVTPKVGFETPTY